MENDSSGAAGKRKAKDIMGAAFAETDEGKGEHHKGGDKAGKGQESAPDLADATRPLK